jgi:hypothetical protein
MFVGAALGALLVLDVSIVYPLIISLAVIATVSVSARALSRRDPAWVQAR